MIKNKEFLYKRWTSKKLSFEETDNLIERFIFVLDGHSYDDEDWHYFLLIGTKEKKDKLEQELKERGIVHKNRRPKGITKED